MRPLKAFLSASLLAALVAAPLTSVHAQDATPAADGAMAGRASVESVKHLLDVMQARKLVESMRKQMTPMLNASVDQVLKSSPTPLSTEEQAAARQAAAAVFDAMMKQFTWETFEPIYIKVYTATFTQDEVNGMTAFYSTPAGQSTISKMPQVMQRTMQEMQPMMQGMVGDMQAKIQKSMEDIEAKHAATSPSPKSG